MSKFNKIDTIGIIRSTGIVPVFYNADPEISKKVVKACYDGGIRAFEFTNRGDGAHKVFEQVMAFVRKECPDMVLGAGTILDAPTAALYMQMGADFLVSPCMVEEVVKVANRRGIPYSPGCGSVTEIVHAQELGCDLVNRQCGRSFLREEHPGPAPLVHGDVHRRGRTHRGEPYRLGEERRHCRGYGLQALPQGSGEGRGLESHLRPLRQVPGLV